MEALTVLSDALSRPFAVGRWVLQDITVSDLNTPLAANTNTIAWLLWHTGREADVQLADLSGGPEVWAQAGYAARLGLPEEDFGLGHTAEQAAAITVDDPQTLAAYLQDVEDAMAAYLRGLQPADLDDIIDTRYDPPVTRAARLVSIIDDAAQHVGQAAFVRGSFGWDAERP